MNLKHKTKRNDNRFVFLSVRFNRIVSLDDIFDGTIMSVIMIRNEKEEEKNKTERKMRLRREERIAQLDSIFKRFGKRTHRMAPGDDVLYLSLAVDETT